MSIDRRIGILFLLSLIVVPAGLAQGAASVSGKPHTPVAPLEARRAQLRDAINEE